MRCDPSAKPLIGLLRKVLTLLVFEAFRLGPIVYLYDPESALFEA